MEIALILFMHNKETRGLGKFIVFASLSGKGELFAFWVLWVFFFTFTEKIHLEKIKESSVTNWYLTLLDAIPAF